MPAFDYAQLQALNPNGQGNPIQQLQMPGQGQPPGQQAPGAPDPGQTPAVMPAQNGGGYTPDQFNNWYSQQFGSGPSGDVVNQIGGQIGAAAGPNGTYSQQQWDQAQTLAKQGGQKQPFFSEFQAPTYQAGPAYEAPKPFQAPTMEQAMADPGYQFSLQQGTKQLEGSAAARGVARTGGTLKSLIDYGQQSAAQQYGNVYDRAAKQYNQDYQIGRDAWGANQQQRDGAFDRNYKGASDQFNAKFRGQELTMADLLSRWNTNVNVNAQMAMAD